MENIFKIKNEFGYCYYEFVQDCISTDCIDYVHIYSLYVYPKFRRQGKARELLLKAISEIRSAEFTGKIRIVAQPTEDSIDVKELKDFYYSLGLEVYDSYM